MNSYQIGIFVVVAIIAVAGIAGTVVSAIWAKGSPVSIFGFCSTLCLALIALVQVDKIAVKTESTETKVDTALVEQKEAGTKLDAAVVKIDETAAKADTAAVKVEEIAVTAAETKVATEDKLTEIKKAAEDTRELVQTKLNP